MRVFIAGENETINSRIQNHLTRKGHDCIWADMAMPDQVATQLTESNASFSVFILSPAPERTLVILESVRSLGQMRRLAIGPATDPQLILRTLREGCDQYADEMKAEIELDHYISKLTKEEYRPHRRRAWCRRRSSTLRSISPPYWLNKSSCVLYDMKPGVGDLAALLDLKPTFTLADLCVNGARFDSAIFERSLAQHSCGVHLLAPPRTLKEVRQVTPEGIRQAVNMGRMSFNSVVADLDDCFHEEQVQALQLADAVLLVLRLDFTSLRNAQRVLEHLEAVGLKRDDIQIVVNRFGQPKELGSGIAGASPRGR